MARTKQLPQDISNTGYTANAGMQRIMNRDGSLNVQRKGLNWWQRNSIYHTMISLSPGRFMLVVFLFYTSTNLLFASIYTLLGIDKLQGIDPVSGFGEKFMQAFFFSSQTLTTVGYGHISPKGMAANIVASLESFIGIMAFAIVTGLFFARFARPRAFLRFSDNLIMSPFKESAAFMLRVISAKNISLTDVQAEVTTAFEVEEHGKKSTRYFQLPLQFSRINSLALSWTVVHIIDDKSPFYGLSLEEIKKSNLEVMINVRAFDEHYSNTVQQRISYKGDEILYGARFLPAFAPSEDGRSTILKVQKLNHHEKLEETHVAAILEKIKLDQGKSVEAKA
jgi:inward rectifier potassium channel